MRKLLTTENIISGILVSTLAWVSLSTISSKEAIASLQTAQVENTRINEVVINFATVMPRVEASLEDIKETVDKQSADITSIKTGQRDAMSRLYCVSTFPVTIDDDINIKNEVSRNKCIKQLIGPHATASSS